MKEEECAAVSNSLIYPKIPEISLSITSLMAQTVKRLPTVWEMWFQSLGQENLLKEMVTHSSTLAWKILWTEDPDRL